MDIYPDVRRQAFIQQRLALLRLLQQSAPRKTTKTTPRRALRQAKRAPRERRALLIGIEYVGPDKTEDERLPGCFYDVSVLQDLLIHHYGYARSAIRSMTDESLLIHGARTADDRTTPTAANIKKELKKLVRWTRSRARRNLRSDLFISYSGHGTQVADRKSDEKDRRDEAIVGTDYQLITDDWLHKHILKQFPTRHTRIFLLFDSCNSGTALDLPYLMKRGRVSSSSSSSSSRTVANPNIVYLSGCLDNQLSASVYARNNIWRGALTWAFQEEMKRRKYVHYVHPSKFLGRIQKFIRKNLHVSDQTPILSFSRNIHPNRKIFIL
jgi:hypothetical protein